jgi:PAS domain S-box-containing protein
MSAGTPDSATQPMSAELDVDKLRARLAEADETLRALREGLVDAIVVGDRVFTLEGAHAESNRLRGDALSQMDDAVVATDRDGHVIYMNPAAERLHARAASGTLGRAVGTLYTERWYSDADRAQAEAASAGLAPWRGHSVHRRPDGTEFQVESSISALRDGSGAPTGTLIVFRDVSERMRESLLQRALVTLSDRIRDIDDPADLAYATAEILGRTLGVSRAGYGIVDRTAETITVKRDWNAPGIVTIAGVLKFREHGTYIDDLLRGETVIVSDVYDDPRTASTAEMLCRISARAFINMPVTENGNFVGLLYLNHADARPWPEQELRFIRDVAERARVAIDRREVQQQLVALARSLERQVADRTQERDRTWVLSRDLLGVCDAQGVFLSSNPAWQAVLGWRQVDLRDMRFADLVHPDDLAATHRALARLNVGTASVRFENRVRHRDGGFRDLAWSIVPDEARFYTVARDITEEKRSAVELENSQRQLRQSQKLEAVGQLTGGIAHDFNNLLQVVSSNLQLMSRNVADPEKLQQRIEASRAAVSRGAQLSKQLLAFSRQQALEPQVTDMGSLVQGMADMLQRALGEAIEIAITVPPGLWRTFVDPAQVENAVLNLSINARDAMGSRGRLSIELANTPLDLAYTGGEVDVNPGDYVLLAVSDTGSGMPPDVVAKAFEPFFTTKPVGSGSGLGLSMVYGFVKQSSGHAKIYSEVGSGTSVKMYLPRSEVEADVRVASAEPDELGGTESILVVEDDPAVLVAAVDLLSELGYVVLTATDAASALAVLEGGAVVDLLFTDVVMPGPLTSPELAARARVLLPEVAVLYTSGYPQNAIVHGGRLDAGVELLHKPYTRSDLAKKVRAALGVAAAG